MTRDRIGMADRANGQGNTLRRWSRLALGLAALSASAAVAARGGTLAATPELMAGVPSAWKPLMEFPNPSGRVAVATTGAPVDPLSHPFFTLLGPNGRACVTCHRPADAMGLSSRTAQREWRELGWQAPLFAGVDGANCPSLPQDKAASHSLLLERGVFRIGLAWPPRRTDGTVIEPEFTLRVMTDPTGCNTDPKYGIAAGTVSVFRRPRMVANMRYILEPMHENNTKTMAPLDRDPETGKHVSMSLMSDARQPSLRTQMAEAAHGHMEMGGGLNSAQMREIEDFEKRVFVAQNWSNGAGSLGGGPKALGVVNMRDGRDHINGNDRDTGVFFTFEQWRAQSPKAAGSAARAAFRDSVARGNDIFFNRPFWIDRVVGLNNIRLGNPYKQTCAFCHNTQMTGHDDVPGWMDLGTVNFPLAPPNADLPVFEIVCKPSAAPHPYLGRRIYTNDPGRALVSGKCLDVGGIVMQQFRGMAARAPYFANGSARSIREVVDFYERRFNMGMTEQDKVDLTNFLSVL